MGRSDGMKTGRLKETRAAGARRGRGHFFRPETQRRHMEGLMFEWSLPEISADFGNTEEGNGGIPS